MNQVEQQTMSDANVPNKINATREVRLLLEVFVRVYFKKPELEYAIKFLVGAKVEESNAFRLISPMEKKLYGSGNHKSADYWKKLSRVLAQRGFFECKLSNPIAGNRDLLALSDKQLFEEQIYLTMKAQQLFISKSQEFILDASEVPSEQMEVLVVPEILNVQVDKSVSSQEEITFIGETSKPKKRLRTSRAQKYKAFSIMSEAPSSYPSDTALTDFDRELKEALHKLSAPHVRTMVKMLEPFGDCYIYFMHAFFFYSTVMIGQHKIVPVDEVADLLAECVRLGFPLHLSSLEIDYKMIEEVHDKVKECGRAISDPKLIVEKLPPGHIDLNRLKIVLAILEFEYRLEDEEDCNGDLFG